MDYDHYLQLVLTFYFFSILEKAKVTAEEAKAAHNYTDTAGFTLK